MLRLDSCAFAGTRAQSVPILSGAWDRLPQILHAEHVSEPKASLPDERWTSGETGLFHEQRQVEAEADVAVEETAAERRADTGIEEHAASECDVVGGRGGDVAKRRDP